MLAWLLERVVASVLFSVKWGQEGVLHERHKQLRAQKAFCTVYGDGHTLVHNEQSSLLDGKLDLASGRKWAVRETRVRSLSWEYPLEKEKATHSSTLAWKIPWTEELGGLQSMESQRVGHD